MGGKSKSKPKKSIPGQGSLMSFLGKKSSEVVEVPQITIEDSPVKVPASIVISEKSPEKLSQKPASQRLSQR